MISLFNYILEGLKPKDLKAIKKMLNKSVDPNAKSNINNIKFVKDSLSQEQLEEIYNDIDLKNTGFKFISFMFKQKNNYFKTNDNKDITCNYTIFVDIKQNIPICIIGITDDIKYEEGFKHIALFDSTIKDISILNQIFKTYIEEVKKLDTKTIKGFTYKFINNVKDVPIKYNNSSFEMINKKDKIMHLIF